METLPSFLELGLHMDHKCHSQISLPQEHREELGLPSWHVPSKVTSGAQITLRWVPQCCPGCLYQQQLWRQERPWIKAGDSQKSPKTGAWHLKGGREKRM